MIGATRLPWFSDTTSRKTENNYGVRFPWAFETGVFVVRAYDYTRNASLNEREVSLAD